METDREVGTVGVSRGESPVAPRISGQRSRWGQQENVDTLGRGKNSSGEGRTGGTVPWKDPDEGKRELVDGQRILCRRLLTYLPDQLLERVRSSYESGGANLT